MRILTLVFTLFLTANAYAIFCPTNFTSVDYGDSVEKVVSQCGKPSEYHEYNSNGNLAQQWTFFVNPNGYQNKTAKLVVLFNNNAVQNITLEDENQNINTNCQSFKVGQFETANCQTQPSVQSLTSTQICGFPIKLGDTQQVVQVACGKPALTQQVQSDDPNNSQVLKMAAALYQGPPQVVLIFENGALKERKFL